MKNIKLFALLTAFLLVLGTGASNVYAEGFTEIKLEDQTAFQNIAGVGCTIAKYLNGPIARTIATMGIIFLGFGAFFGKLNWGAVLTTALGIFVIFGAAQIITAVGSNTGNDVTGKDNKCGSNTSS
jgi:type IV secretion system protein VirB2